NANTVSVLLGDGVGGFGAQTDFATGTFPYSVAIGDVNGDGKPDLAVADGSASTGARRSGVQGRRDGGEGRAHREHEQRAGGDCGSGIGCAAEAIGGVNGDGKAELGVASCNANTVSVLLGDGVGGFGAKTDFATGTGPYSVTIGDVNGDGKPDLAVANGSSST